MWSTGDAVGAEQVGEVGWVEVDSPRPAGGAIGNAPRGEGVARRRAAGGARLDGAAHCVALNPADEPRGRPVRPGNLKFDLPAGAVAAHRIAVEIAGKRRIVALQCQRLVLAVAPQVGGDDPAFGGERRRGDQKAKCRDDPFRHGCPFLLHL